MTPLQTYLTALQFVRTTGAGVAETSYYPALSALLDAVGSELQPTVRCVGQLANFLGVGSPDFGLYSADQFPRKSDLAARPAAGQKPARGVIEAKGAAADVPVRDALEEALGFQFKDDKGEHFFRSTLVQTLFYGVFSAWVLWSRENPAPAARFDWRLAAWSLRVPILRTLLVRKPELAEARNPV